MANPNDPWNQNFGAFKTDYKASPLREFIVFNVSDLQASGATHIVFYTVKDPSPNASGNKSIAVAVDYQSPNVQRKLIAGSQYVVAMHNCPPDCENIDILPTVTNLLNKVNPNYVECMQ